MTVVFVVTEWNCMVYEDSDTSVVGAFMSLEEASAFIAGQPERIGGKVDRPETKKDRFCVEEFVGAKCLAVYGVRADGRLSPARSAGE